MSIVVADRLSWRDVARVGDGDTLSISREAEARLAKASAIVESIVAAGTRAYGINTGVGALSDTVVDRQSQSRLSRNIVLSHACGVGPLLAALEVRAIIAAQIANFAHGHSGVRPEIVATLAAMLEHDCIPEVPSKGSAGYLSHNAHTALVLIGEGYATVRGERKTGREALEVIGLQPLVLRAKEGLSLVNGTACATGLLSVALGRAERLLSWADAAAALTLEAVGCQMAAFDEAVLALRPSSGIAKVGAGLRARLAGSALIAMAAGKRTQDALSLRAVPHAHGAAWDVFEQTGAIADQELASVTDNPAVSGTPENPVVSSEAHAVAPALALAADSLAIAIAQLSSMSERRTDRLVNPLVSGLPAFLASDAGSHSGFMIAQYTAAALSNENRRLAAPAATDGGITSALQEDFLAHPTAAANKLLAILDNAEHILAIELMAAAQAHDFLTAGGTRAKGTEAIHSAIRSVIDHYEDDRPLGADIETLKSLIAGQMPQNKAREESMPADFDVAIIGLGAMGSAAAAFAAARGAKVIGIEAHYPAHALSSSHGDSRLIRLGYFEDPSYVPLLKRAYENWRALEARLREEILTVTGVLQIGRPDSKIVSGTLSSCKMHGLTHELLDKAEMARRYPAFALDDDEIGLLDPQGGYIRPEAAIMGYLKLAAADGAELHFGERVEAISPDADGVTVVSANGRYRARKVIVATGAWIAELVPELVSKAQPIRQVVAWYQPEDGFIAQPGRMTCFLRDDGENGSFFGFPAIGDDGVKIGRHAHFREPIDPRLPNPPVNGADTELLDTFARKRLPKVASHRIRATTCRYTMLPSEDFLIDFVPGNRNVVVSSACSGHGFKFTSVIGEILSDLALDGGTKLPTSLFSFERHFQSR